MGAGIIGIFRDFSISQATHQGILHERGEMKAGTQSRNDTPGNYIIDNACSFL